MPEFRVVRCASCSAFQVDQVGRCGCCSLCACAAGEDGRSASPPSSAPPAGAASCCPAGLSHPAGLPTPAGAARPPVGGAGEEGPQVALQVVRHPAEPAAGVRPQRQRQGLQARGAAIQRGAGAGRGGGGGRAGGGRAAPARVPAAAEPGAGAGARRAGSKVGRLPGRGRGACAGCGVPRALAALSAHQVCSALLRCRQTWPGRLRCPAMQAAGPAPLGGPASASGQSRAGSSRLASRALHSSSSSSPCSRRPLGMRGSWRRLLARGARRCSLAPQRPGGQQQLGCPPCALAQQSGKCRDLPRRHSRAAGGGGPLQLTRQTSGDPWQP